MARTWRIIDRTIEGTQLECPACGRVTTLSRIRWGRICFSHVSCGKCRAVSSVAVDVFLPGPIMRRTHPSLTPAVIEATDRGEELLPANVE